MLSGLRSAEHELSSDVRTTQGRLIGPAESALARYVRGNAIPDEQDEYVRVTKEAVDRVWQEAAARGATFSKWGDGSVS